MAKPDKPGFWKSRDGRKVIIHEFGRELYFRLVEDTGHTVGLGKPINDLFGNDWLPYDEPEFPKLPEKPKLSQCYVHWFPNAGHKPAWRTFSGGQCREAKNMPLREYVVIPHPDNDPEAVKLIEEARKAA